MSDVTQILKAIERGDSKATGELLPLVYEELRKLAAQRMAHEPSGHTLQPTALVHEAYVRLVDSTNEQEWDGRGHFFSAAAEAMRRILVERARRKSRVRHGGDQRRRNIDVAALAEPKISEDVIALDEALVKLAQKDETKAELVKLRYFAGLTLEQAAHVLGISTTTADRYWAFARAWLHQEVIKGD